MFIFKLSENVILFKFLALTGHIFLKITFLEYEEEEQIDVLKVL